MEAATSIGAFDTFAESATLAGSPVTVIIDREIHIHDGDGNVMGRGARAAFKLSDVPSWTAGDLLTVGTDNFRIREEIANDGYIVSFLAHPVTVP